MRHSGYVNTTSNGLDAAAHAPGSVNEANAYFVEADVRLSAELPFLVKAGISFEAPVIGHEQLTEAQATTLTRIAADVDSTVCEGPVCISRPIGWWLDGTDDPEVDRFTMFYLYADGTARCEDCGQLEIHGE